MPDCRCQGKGVYVVAPEMRGYHRALSLDRHAYVPVKQHVWGSQETVQTTRKRLSTAYANSRGDVYHFAADDPGGFGVRCPEHAPGFEPVIHATMNHLDGELFDGRLNPEDAAVQVFQSGASGSDPSVVDDGCPWRP